MSKALDENIASPVGVWLRDGQTVYRLKESAEPGAFHKGVRLRVNEVYFHVHADDETKAVNLAEKITALLREKP